jgi:hypothetical protein
MLQSCAVIFFDPSQNLVVAIEEMSQTDFVRYRDSERYSAAGSRPKSVEEAIAGLGPHIKEFKVVTAR